MHAANSEGTVATVAPKHKHSTHLFLPELETKIVECRKERCDEATTPKVPRERLLLLRELFLRLFPGLLFCPGGFVGGLILSGHRGDTAGFLVYVGQDYGTGRGGPGVDPIVQLLVRG